MTNLWPDDIVDTTATTRTPVTILKEQASLLGNQTQNLVMAEVAPISPPTPPKNVFLVPNVATLFGVVKDPAERERNLHFAFYIVAPTFEHYRYRLFTIEHGINMYPVKFHIDRDILEEAFAGGNPSANDQNEYLETLRVIFNSRKTRRIINVLLDLMQGFTGKSSSVS